MPKRDHKRASTFVPAQDLGMMLSITARKDRPRILLPTLAVGKPNVNESSASIAPLGAVVRINRP